MAFPIMNTPVSTNASSPLTTLAVNMPASVSAGQRLMMMVGFLSSAGTISTPSGWTLLLAPSGSGFAVFEKVAVGNEGGTTVTVTNSVSGSNRQALAWTVDGSDASKSTQLASAQGTATTADPPNLVPIGGAQDWLWLALVGPNNSNWGPVSAYPTNYTLQQANIGSMGVAGRQLNASSEDPGVFTRSGGGSQAYTAVTMAIPPIVPLRPPGRRRPTVNYRYAA